MPRPTSFGKDTGLQLRMTFTLFLLGLVYVVLIVALLGSGVNGVTVGVIAGGLALFQLFGSDKLALRAMGAREVTPAEAPELHAMIDRLCVQADLPKPKVAVADTRMPNAFALGRSPKSATVCATTGIMELLSPAELEGVMAHELSRYREFAADRGAALITGRPSALASALTRISSGMQRIPQQDLRAQRELAAFYIFPPGAGKAIGGLFATHPPMEKRIAALERLEMQLQGTAA